MQTVDVQQRYREALDSFIAKVKQDSYIIAAILGGSLSHDTVWEKSDIDLLLITREGRKQEENYCLVENGINIHAVVTSRSKFKEMLERALQSSFTHSYFSKSTLLFTTDEMIEEYYENVKHLGARDREMQLLLAGTWVLPILAKAEKWLYVKNDPTYSFLWIMKMVDQLAAIEVLQNGEITGREVVQQALRFNPTFFDAIYAGLIQQPKDATTIRHALDLINDYINERTELLFKPILDYLQDAGGTRSTTELDEYFKKKVQVDSLAPAYEWLADRDILQKVSSPVRLTEKSRVAMDEAAYYYNGGDATWTKRS